MKLVKVVLGLLPVLIMALAGRHILHFEPQEEAFSNSGTEVQYHLAHKAGGTGPVIG